MKLALFPCAALLLMFSCGNPDAVHKGSDSAADNSAVTTNPPAHDCRVEAKFVIENLPEDTADYSVPQSMIRVRACDSLYEIAKVAGYPEVFAMKEFREKEVPGEALTACGGWYAGGGDYYYLVINKNNGIDVYHGWQDEAQTDSGYHWQKLKELKKN